MNRRNFISLLAGAAGAPLVAWRGLIEPMVVLPARPHVCDSPWCNHPAHAASLTAEQIVEDIERCLQQLLRNSGPIPYTHDGLHLIEAHIGESLKKFVPPRLAFKVDGQNIMVVR